MAQENGNGQLPHGEEAREIEASRALGEFLDRAATGSSPNLLAFLTEHPHVASELAGPLHTFEELASILEVPSVSGSFGDFQILREVGQGGMGIVYEAWQVSLNRRVALKVLPRERLGVPQALARFHREAKLVASLEHPNIVRIHVTGIEDGIPYFAMEFAEGETLRQLQKRLQSNGRSLSPQTVTDRGIQAFAAREVVTSPGCEPLEDEPSETYWLDGSGFHEQAPGAGPGAPLLELSPRLMAQFAGAFAEAADGLQHAHTRGVVHRDIKPSNLLLDSSGHLRILDFGLAIMEGDPRLTLSEERIGTPLYMSPEQARGDSHSLSRGTDIYSLGATLYEILSGSPPFQGRSCQETLQQIIHREPQPLRRLNPDIAFELETIVMKCLRKDPRERYATAEALAQDLRRFVRGEPIEARPQSACAVLAWRAWRSRRRIAEAACGLLLLAAFGFIFVHKIRESRRQKEEGYISEVRVASATFNQKPVLLAAASIRELDGEKVLLPLKPGETVLSARREGGYQSLFEVGRDVVEAGAALVEAAPDPVQLAVERLKRAIQAWPDPPVGYYHLARGLLLLQDTDGAEKQLLLALEKDPRFIPALTLLASVRLARGAPGAAQAPEAIALDASRSRGGWAVDWFEAHRATLARNWKAAEHAYGELIRSQSAGAEHFVGSILEARLGRGLARLAIGDRDGALVDFAAAMEHSSAEIESALLLGKTFFLKGDRERAAEIFTQMAEGITPSRTNEAVQAIATTYGELREFEAALAWLEKMQAGPVQLCLKAEALRSRGLLDEARRASLAAVSASPSAPSGHLTLGNVLMSEGGFADAEAAYRRAAALDPRSPKPRVALGICLEAQGMLDDAQKELLAALALDTQMSQAHYNLGRILGKLGRLDDAVKAYDRCTELDISNALAFNNRGTVFDRQGRLEDALLDYERAIKLSPKLALAHYNAAWAYHRQMRFDRAAGRYREAILLGLDDSLLHNNLGPCLQHTGKIGEAIAAYKRAIVLDPGSALAHHGLGTALEHRNDLQQMITAYGEAVRLLPRWVEARNDLGWALHRHGRLEEAMAEYRMAIDLDSKFVWAHNNLATLILANERFFPAGGDLRQMIRNFEDAERLPNASPAIGSLLEKCRRALAPDLASYASIDAVLDAPRSIIPEGGEWRYPTAASEPFDGLEWTGNSFDDVGWESGPIGAGGIAGKTGAAAGSGPGRTILHLRHRFSVPEPGRLASLVLRVQVQDGFVAYLNGVEVARLRVGSGDGGLEPTAMADAREAEPWLSRRFPMDAQLLRAGDNLLAVQAVKHWSNGSQVSVIPVLEAALAGEGDTETRQEAAAALEAFRAVAGDALLVTYFESRLLEREGKYSGAEARLRSVIASDASRPEPFIHLAACLRANEDREGAAGCLRGALESGLQQHEELWSAWLRAILVDLDQGPADVLTAFPAINGEARKGAGGDLLWLFRTLDAEGALRINCGGADYQGSDGRTWSKDRFFRNGYLRYLTDHAPPGAVAEDDALYLTARDFWEPQQSTPAYSIPLPAGRYVVSLSLVERNRGRSSAGAGSTASFEVLLEGRPVPAQVEVRGPGTAAPGSREVEVEVAVADGALDIDFVRRSGDPLITAIEVRRL